MMIRLENEAVCVDVATLGGELRSLVDRDRDRELLWSGQAEIWPRRAPVLFPIVGRLAQDRARFPSGSLPMGQHGFARDLDWRALDCANSSLHLRLESTVDTLAIYPYRFELDTHYSLAGRSLQVEHRVRNLGEQSMPFSIGAHPGFRCPFAAGDRFEDCLVEFEVPETAQRIVLEAGLRTGARVPCLDATRELPLTRALFADDALIFDSLASRHVTLRSRSAAGGLRMHFDGFPYFALWSKPHVQAPFICFEPWFGVADAAGDPVAFADKAGMQILAPAAEFHCSYRIELL